MERDAGTRWPKGFACNNGLLHPNDPTPRVLMVAAAHNPCQPSQSLGGDSVCEMGNVGRSSGQSRYSWEWPNHSYQIATQSAVGDGPTLVVGTHLFVVSRR